MKQCFLIVLIMLSSSLICCGMDKSPPDSSSLPEAFRGNWTGRGAHYYIGPKSIIVRFNGGKTKKWTCNMISKDKDTVKVRMESNGRVLEREITISPDRKSLIMKGVTYRYVDDRQEP